MLYFADVKDAYYSAVRELVYDLPADPADRRDLLESIPVPPVLQDTLQDMMAGAPLANAIVQDEHLRRQLEDVFSLTWFGVADASQVARPRKGTRPGDSLADMSFNVVAARLFAEVVSVAAARGQAPFGHVLV